MVTHGSIVKSSSKYGLGPTETRSCDMRNSPSGLTVVRSDRWPLYRTSALSPDTRSRTVDCSRGGGEKCRDEASVPSLGEVVSRRRNSVVADLLPDACLYDTGGHTRWLTQPSGCVGADSVAEHTQLAKWQRPLRGSQCEPLDDIEKSLEVLSSRGDNLLLLY